MSRPPFSVRTMLMGLMIVDTIAACLIGVSVMAQAPVPRVLPITDPTQLPRLAFEDLNYQGAIRLPADELEGVSFASGGGPIAFNPRGNTLYVGTRAGRIAEITLPTPVDSATIEALPVSRLVQQFFDPAEGQMREVGDEAALAGLLVYQDRLYGTGLIYYDANNTQLVSHFSRPLALRTAGGVRMRRVGEKGRSGFVAGYMAAVPPEWQTRLGGPALTGQCCVPIISRTSWGPAAFVWDPATLDRAGEPSATPLVFYDSQHPTLGAFEASGAAFGGTTMVSGLAVIGGTRTALFVGSNGTGQLCYGNGTSDRSLVDTVGADGAKYCYDPTTSDKGQHAFPYHYTMWAYDLNDFAQVRAGKRDPWEVKPYSVWTFTLPVSEPGTRLLGVAYDPAARRLFLSQRHADRDGYAYRALIHVYQIP